MKRKIIFGSLLSVFLMLMIPAVPAVEYNNVLEASESRLLAEIKNMDIRELKERIQDLNTKQLKEKILNIDVNEFENFEIDSYVNTACPRLDMNGNKVINASKL